MARTRLGNIFRFTAEARLAVMLLFLFPPCVGAGAAAQDKHTRPKVRIAYSSISGNAVPLWVTYEQGIFRKYGLDVDLVFIESGSTTAEALISGNVTIAQMSGASVIQNSLRGADIVMVGGLVNTLTFELHVNPAIREIAQLKGKSLGVTRVGSSTDFATHFVLDKYGLTPPQDVSIVELGSMSALLSALRSGRIHGAMLSAPFTFWARKAGSFVLVDLQSLALEYQHSGIATTRARIQSDPQLVAKVTRAYIDGVYYMKNYPCETLEWMAKYMKTDDTEALTETLESLAFVVPKKPYPTLQGIKIMLAELASTDPRAMKAQPQQFVDMRFVRELDASGFIDRLYGPAKATRREASDPMRAAGNDGGVDYIVRRGDTLCRIAESFYDSGLRWPRIYEANRESIKSPNLIPIGQKIKVPF